MVRHVLATGQRECFDADGHTVRCAGSGQDGETCSGVPWPSPRFEELGGVVEDRLTGIQWLRTARPFEWALDWWETLEQVEKLNRDRHEGFSDWRLPNRRELSSLVSFRESSPALPAGHPFEDVFLGWYWSSTTAARSADYAWCLQLTGGRLFYEHKDRYAFAWPCRGASGVLPRTGQRRGDDCEGRPAHQDSSQDGDPPHGVEWPEPRFEAVGDAIRDRLTDIMWAREAHAAADPTDWEGALASVHDVDNGDGRRRRWRLPTINELESLVDASRHDPALPGAHPFRGVRESYWSSTTSSVETDWAMVLHLNRGAVGVGYKRDRRFWAWPVVS
jgi:hypothetical protein